LAMNAEELQDAPAAARELAKDLLVVDASSRLSAVSGLQHHWFQAEVAEHTYISRAVDTGEYAVERTAQSVIFDPPWKGSTEALREELFVKKPPLPWQAETTEVLREELEQGYGAFQLAPLLAPAFLPVHPEYEGEESSTAGSRKASDGFDAGYGDAHVIFRFTYHLPARQLDSRNSSAVSSAFFIPAANLPFRVQAVAQQTHNKRNGRCFKKANGHGKLELKCESSAASLPRLTFSFLVGSQRRGPVTHNFQEVGNRRESLPGELRGTPAGGRRLGLESRCGGGRDVELSGHG